MGGALADSSLLQVNNLSVEFSTPLGTVKAVTEVSWLVSPGQILAIVGESGSGKSVTALSILQLIPTPPGRIVSGQVLFGKTDLLRLSEDQIRKFRGRKISMVFQEPMTSLNPVLSIGRQITEQMKLHLGLDTAEARERAIELLTRVGISEPKDRLRQYPHHFSGGMRQRVMIAMALSCDPELIIADEPTTALDVTIQAQILQLMQRLCREMNVGLVIITHNLGVVARYADRVSVMYAGRIVEEGDAGEIYARPQHPYTYGLLNSVPRLDSARASNLIPIPGSPPDLVDLPPGCSFRPRCHIGRPNCETTIPELTGAVSGHQVACPYTAEISAETRL